MGEALRLYSRGAIQENIQIWTIEIKNDIKTTTATRNSASMEEGE